jgi:hypothetical protein
VTNRKYSQVSFSEKGRNMNQTNVTQEGGCRCGQVRIKMTVPPFLTMACHCTGCQRMTGSAFSLSAAFPSNAFSVTKGEPVIGGLHGSPRHYFCPHCMSWLFTRPDGFDFVNVRATMLDDPLHSIVDFLPVHRAPSFI